MAEPIWQDMRSAPYSQEVELRLETGRVLRAILCPDASMTDAGKPCDQWQATTDDHPKCWSDGACWDSNADETMSLQPNAWRHLASAMSARSDETGTGSVRQDASAVGDSRDAQSEEPADA